MGHSVDTDEESDSVTVDFSVSATVGDSVSASVLVLDTFTTPKVPGDFVEDEIDFEVSMSVTLD